MCKKNVRASVTVEASFIVSMTIIVIGIMISLWIYEYQLCWYTQAMSECLLTGSNQGIFQEEDCQQLIEEKWRVVSAGNYLVPKELFTEINCDKDRISMDIIGKTLVGSDQLLNFKIEQEIKLVRPVQFIRRVSAIKGEIGN